MTPESRDDGSVYPIYEERITYLASQKCNLIAIEGAPPFMLLGSAREAEMVDGWKRKYNIDMFTAPQNQVDAFRALKAKRILGITAGANGADVMISEGIGAAATAVQNFRLRILWASRRIRAAMFSPFVIASGRVSIPPGSQGVRPRAGG
jgi:hypothetical protein